jgi:O-antigen/teichoic acid export membrane protein
MPQIGAGMPASQMTLKRHFIKRLASQIEWSAVKMPLILSLLNQVVSSGGNFLISVYLARTLSLADFGLYGISYGICQIYIGAGNAILPMQMMVNMPDKQDVDKDAYASRILLGVLMLGTLTLIAVALGILALIFLQPDWQRFSGMITAISLAAVAFLSKDFFISYAYIRRRETLALAVSMLSVGILCGGLLSGYLAGIPLSAQNVLMLYALADALAATYGYWSSPLGILRNRRNLMPDFVEAWVHGRWALGGAMATWAQTQTYTYVLAFFLGPVGVGQANAARILISPFNFLIPAINQIAIPRLADLRESDRRKMLRVSLMITAGLFLLAIVYSALLLGSLDFVFSTILGRHDEGILVFVPIWCAFLIIHMTLTGGIGLLQVMRRFRALTLFNIAGTAVAIVSAIALIQRYGATGAIWGMVAGEFMLTLLIWKEIRSVHKEKN